MNSRYYVLGRIVFLQIFKFDCGPCSTCSLLVKKWICRIFCTWNNIFERNLKSKNSQTMKKKSYIVTKILPRKMRLKCDNKANFCL